MTSSEPRETYTFRDSQASTNFIARRTASTHASFFLPHLRPGMRLLDAGCGPGSITVGLAEAVAPGEVVGIDNDENHLQRARDYAAAQGLTNVRFEYGDVYALPFLDCSFDAVFAHAVLVHLHEPVQALKEWHRVIKPGGVVGIRNNDTDGWLFAPSDPVLIRFLERMSGRYAEHGGNSQIGKHSRGLLRQAGFARIEPSASYETYGTDETVRAWAMRMLMGLEEGGAQDVERGRLTQEELEATIASIKAWGEHPDAFLARSWCEAIGWRE